MELQHTYIHRREKEILEVADAFIVLVKTDQYPSKGCLVSSKKEKLAISTGLFLGGHKVDVFFVSKTEQFKAGDIIISRTKKPHKLVDDAEAILYQQLPGWNKVLATDENMTEDQLMLLVAGHITDYDHVMIACANFHIITDENKKITLYLPSKQVLNQINEVIDMINRVRCDLNQYYPTVSSNPVYKTNCAIDQDRLQKAILKLHTISKSIEETTNEKVNSKIQRSPIESEADQHG